ncbi:MAG: DNA mismatch repair protein MutS [Firmicutes bacterium]|nr:DNA mismatch repair protein MutS [Bacillota bacterium]
MLRQYKDIKRQYPGMLLFFRLGDFYELFYEDAEVASRELELVLTGRDAGRGERAPMCGIPHHASTQYISRLISKGYRIAVCEQVEDPRTAKGLVNREVVRVITPGTVTDGEMLDERRNNYIASVSLIRGGGRRTVAGVAFADVSTGEFFTTQVEPDAGAAGAAVASAALPELLRVTPSEVLVPMALQNDPAIRTFRQQCPASIVTVYEERAFAPDEAASTMMRQFGVASVSGFGLDGMPAAVSAAGALLRYVRETQKSTVAQLSSVRVYRAGDYVSIDPSTRRNLELVRRDQDGSRRATLLWVLDRTVTAMGARTITAWIERPLRNVAAVEERLNAVGFLVDSPQIRMRLRESLRQVYDMERIAGRVSTGSANARDLVALAQSLETLGEIRSFLLRSLGEAGPPALIRQIVEAIAPLEDVSGLIARAIIEDPPMTLRDGGLIRDGYDATVDSLRSSSRDGKSWISRLEQSEREATGIKSLKVGFNKVFGYYIEVTRPNLHLVPPHYIRRQTLTDAERFVTPELKDRESQVLGAQQNLSELEYGIFCDVRDRVAARCAEIQKRARAVAEADCLASLAEVAAECGYSRPAVLDEAVISIKDGRHPVLEKVLGPERFVPNDIGLDAAGQRVLLITGPNMAGKSTILATTGLIALMAHIGSYVPAAAATIGLLDAVFYRTGSYEDLSGGRSTFMVELSEVAGILNSATARSLVLVDELGRGTSTYDGMALAQAALEYLHDEVGCLTLFTTHYHELAQVERRLAAVRNFHVTAVEKNGELTFLYRLTPGSVDRSYGVNVARMAGLPREVIRRAQVILRSLEEQSPSRPRQISLLETAAAAGGGERSAGGAGGEDPAGPDSAERLTPAEAEVLAAIRGADVNNMTPMESLARLSEMQKTLKESG